MNKQSRFSANHAVSSLPGPDDITRVELDNGITVLTRSNFNSPSISVRGYIRVGSLFDPVEKLGLADFTATALTRGTNKRDFQAFHNALETVGATLGFNGGVHTTAFGGKSLVEDLSLLLDLLSEALRQPAFPDRYVERLRSQYLTSLTLRDQNTGEMASLAFDQIVYQGHPYSRPEEGYPQTIRSIKKEDLSEFHRQHYGPDGLIIALVGAVSAEQAVEHVRKTLGNWENPQQPEPPALPPVTPLQEEVVQKVTLPGKIQADVVIGAAGPPRRSEHFYPAALGNSVLGQFGMMGRIGDAVREKAGLAYYSYSQVSGGIGPGPWAVMAGVNPANVEKAIELIRAEIERFVTEPVSEEELDDSKANFIGRLPLAMESNSGVASALINLERYKLGMDFYLRYAEMIKAVTPADVLETAQRYLHPDRLAIAIAGPEGGQEAA